MPKTRNNMDDTVGNVKDTKKSRKKPTTTTHGATCGTCGEHSGSAKPGTPHHDCTKEHQDPQMRAGVALAIYSRAPWVTEYLGEDYLPTWMTSQKYAEFQTKLFNWMSTVRNFRLKSGQWENGFGQPVNFKTGEVLDIKEMAPEELQVAA